MNQLNHTMVNPRYVQIKRKEAAQILGVGPTEFDRMRKEDPRCPQGHTRSDTPFARVFFRLSDIYAYSEALMGGSQEAMDEPTSGSAQGTG